MKRFLAPPCASLFRLLLLLLFCFGTPQVLALNVTLAWNANPEPDVAGYRLYYGTPLGNFGTMVNVGKVTQFQLTGLDGTKSYSFRLTCYNTAGLESDPSSPVQYTPPTGNQAPTANPLAPTTPEDTTINITLSGSDPESSTLTYSIVTPPTQGTLAGTPPNVTFRPATNYFGYASFTYKVNDGQLDSAPATVGVTVQPVNDAPRANAASYTTPSTQPLSIVLSGSDVESSPLTYTVLTQPAKGTIAGSVPNLTYTPINGASGSDSFTFKVNDGNLDSAPATLSVTIQLNNTAPVAQNQSVTTDEDVSRAITLIATDVNNDSLTYSIVSQPTRGTLSGTPPNLTYRPNSDYNGSDSFTFRASDPFTSSATATVSITVRAVNDAPIAFDSSSTLDEDSSTAITLSAVDFESTTLTYVVVTQPTKGTLTGTGSSLTYRPGTNYNGYDSFTWRANDGTTNSTPATVSLTVRPINDAPRANAASITTSANRAVAVTLSGSDVEASPLTYTVLTQPTKGTLSGTAPNLTYTPSLNYSGADSFTFKVNDGNLDSTTATISLTVQLNNTTPVAQNQSITTDEDVPRAITLTATDANSDPLTFTVLTQPTRGTLSGTPPNLTYTPSPDYYGSDSFTFRASDPFTNSAPATVSITVRAVNDPPIAFSSSATLDEDSTTAVTLSALDFESTTLSYSVVTQPTRGTLSGTAPNLTYRPGTNYSGSDSFTWRVNDGTTNSTPATVSLTVRPINDAPRANAASVGTSANKAVAVTLSGSDVEASPLTYTVLTQPTKGTLSGTAPNLTYTPSLNYTGADSFTFKVNDGSLDSTAATISLTVQLNNTAPVAQSQSVTADEDVPRAITLTATDVNSDPLTFGVLTQPTRGTLSGTPPNLTYTPNPDYNGADSFTFRASDPFTNSAPATVSITVRAVNDPPIALDSSTALDEDSTTAITLSALDPETTTLSYSVVTPPTRGTLSGTAPNLTYRPGTNYNGVDSFSWRASDGTTNSTPATVSLTVRPINDPPTATPGSVSTVTDQPVAITLSGSDVEASPLTYTVLTQPTKGTLSGTVPNLTYTPAAGASGADSFTFQVNDGGLNSLPATVSIAVAVGNYPPVATAQTVSLDEDQPSTVTLSASDQDGDPLAYTLVSNPAHGSLSGTPPNLVYTPATNYAGPDSFSFKVNDGLLDSPNATISLTVRQVNDLPTANPQSVATDVNQPVSIVLAGSDIEGTPLTFVVVSGTVHGTLTGSGANRTYTPSQNYLGADSFTFKVNDGTADSPTVTVGIQVLAVNNPPTAQSQNISLDEDRSVTIALYGSDPDQNPLTYLIVTPPAHGSLSGTPPNLLYTPATNYSGADSFTFKVNDGRVDSGVASIAINIREVNDAPVAAALEITGYTGQPLSVTLSGSDPDGDPVSYTVITRPSNGNISGSAPNLTYRSSQGFQGTDTLTFVVDDGFVQSALATVTIRILAAGDRAPTANGRVVNLQPAENSTSYDPLEITLSGSDPENSPLTYQVTSQPRFGTLSGTPPNLIYTATMPFYGVDRFSFKVNDGAQDSPEAAIWIRDSAIIPPAPPLVISNTSIPGGSTSVLLTVDPVPGVEVQLQRSTDLQSWSPISTNTVGGGLNYTDSTASPQSRFFYRTLMNYTGP